MPTTVHLPKALLDAIDRKARTLRVSRNSLIVRALERDLDNTSEWSPGFIERLLDVDQGATSSVDEMLTHIHARRSSKAPPKL